jgi:RNA polymerase sigma-70 factor, ECF subfamily
MASGLSLAIEAVAAFDGDAAETLGMDEAEFRVFYGRTARPLHGFLCHLSGSTSLADDLLQETYYRFLRAKLPEMTEEQRKSYLFRIGANLMRDHLRASKHRDLPASDEFLAALPAAGDASEEIQSRSDFSSVFAQLKPRYREMLWLAYVEGSSHKEIAEVVGLKVQSVRPLLFRAREKLVALLREHGLAPRKEEAAP